MRFNFIKQHLLSFFQRGLASRQLSRWAVLDMLRRPTSITASVNTERLGAFSRLDTTTLFARLGSQTAGLSAAEAAQKLARVGPNIVGQEGAMSGWLHLWLCYRNPFNVLLTVLAVISGLSGDVEATIIISAMVVISTLLRFVQEKRSNNAAERLKAMVSNTATVLRRDGKTGHCQAIELPIEQLVPGELLLLSAGDMIAADVRILSAKDLFLSQAALTGESLPVEKSSDALIEASNPLDIGNLAFMGSNVISGSAMAIVIGTAGQTFFGEIANRVVQQDRTPTQFQAGVNKVSWVLIRFMLVMAPLVLLLNGWVKGDWLEAALFALSIAVGLTPEMLPMIVTSTLAKGAVILSRKKVVVKRLDAIQNFGAMDILCTDKTGTLTQDKIALERHIDIWGQSSDTVLQLAYINSYYQTGLKNLLDLAVLEHAQLSEQLHIASDYQKIDEIPFDFSRRRMSVIVSERDTQHELICKGALDEILAICTQVRHGDHIEPLNDKLLANIRQVATELNQQGLRVVAVAYKAMPPTRDVYCVADESELILAGYVAFLDPAKESTAPAIKALQASGITVKVLTGDNELVTLKVCQDVDLTVNGVVLGDKIDAMSDETLALVAEKATVFARLTPQHKERIVGLLRSKDHVVGFMGDGINDAPALRAADIGISVDSAVDIAKEAADIILLEKSLLVLEAGVIEGRKTFANMLKYIKMTASSNFGNVFSVLVASAFIPFLPMLPIHLLLQNLLYDISQIAIPFDHVDEESLQAPQRWNPNELSRFMLFFGPISSIFDIATFALMWFVFAANTPEQQSLFQSGWFVVGLLSQTLIVHLIRSRKVPFLQSRASWPLLAMTLVIIALGIFLPMGPLASYFSLQALPLSYFPWLIAILLGYMTLTQCMKNIYAKRYGWQ